MSMQKRLQAKHIDDLDVLRFLDSMETPLGWVFPQAMLYRRDGVPCILDAFPSGTPEKIVIAKLSSLCRRGLIDGCTCGCKGAFEITRKGEEHLRMHAGMVSA